MSEFHSYFDASGSRRSHGPLVVAGVVARAVRWRRFDLAWESVLASFEVPYFHRAELNAWEGPFASWKGDYRRRDRFLAELILVGKRFTNKAFARGISTDDFEVFAEQFEAESQVGNVYVLTAELCAAEMENWFYARHGPRRLVHFVEAGDCGQDALLKYAEIHLRCPLNICDAKESSGQWITPFQLCDLIAWECSRAWKEDLGITTPFLGPSRERLLTHIPLKFAVLPLSGLLEAREGMAGLFPRKPG